MATPQPDPSNRPTPEQSRQPSRDRTGVAEVPDKARKGPVPEIHRPTSPDGHEGATEDEVGDRTGPGVGYDQEPEQDRREDGVS